VKNPNVTLKSVENTDVDLTELISKKKNSLVFLPWWLVPFCNAHLAALAEAEKSITRIGISNYCNNPDAPASLKVTNDKEIICYCQTVQANYRNPWVLLLQKIIRLQLLKVLMA
jgi:peroxiredoxin